MPDTWPTALLLFPATYLLGSVNVSILLFKLLGKEDPRSGFSGNPGATNVYRQAGILWAAIVLTFDAGRAVALGFAAVLLLEESTISWLGLVLVLGNRFPCFHRFKGGKGVANYLGFSAVISPLAAVLSGFCWLVVYKVTKIPFIASFAMVSVLSAGTILTYQHNIHAITGTLLTTLFIFFNHKNNIREFLKKTHNESTK